MLSEFFFFFWLLSLSFSKEGCRSKIDDLFRPPCERVAQLHSMQRLRIASANVLKEQFRSKFEARKLRPREE